MPRYAVKVIFGKSDGTVVAPGDYWTAVNVHNPTGKPIVFAKKFAFGWPGEKPGQAREFIEAELGPDQALEIDRDNIREHTGAEPGEFCKGFVVIKSEVELDVVAVYSVIGPREDIALHIEPVAPS